MSSYYEKILATGEVKCIDEEIPFEIPVGWEWCRLRDVIYPPKYGTSSKSLSYGDVPVLRMGNIQDGKVVYDKLVFSNNVEDNRKYILQDGDLLFNRTNSAELVGKTAIFKGNRHVIYAGYLILLRPIKTNSEYLNYIFSSPYVRSYCKEVKTIGVQQCNINAEKISQLLVPIAPFEEQMRIVDKIKEVLPSVDKYSISQYNLDSLNVSLSECLKKSILQEAIQGKLVPQIAEEGTAKELLEQIKKEKQKLVKEGKLKKSALATSVIFRGDDNRYCEKIGKSVQCIDEEIPFEIPESWVWCKFQDIANSELGKTMNKASDKGGEVPYLCSINVYWDKVDLSNVKVAPFSIAEKEKYLLQKGDLLICEGGEVGRCAIWSNDKTMYYQNALHRVRFYGDISSKFIQNVIRIYKTMGIIDKNSKGMTIKHFTKTALNSLYVPLPPFQEQQRIVAQIEKLFEQLH